MNDVRVVKEASYDPESNVATSTYDVSHQLNDRLYASATNVTVSAASLYEVLAGFDADGSAEVLREILHYSQNSDQWASVSVSGIEDDLGFVLGLELKQKSSPIYENNIQIDNLPGGKPSWEQLKSLFDQAQSKISMNGKYYL